MQQQVGRHALEQRALLDQRHRPRIAVDGQPPKHPGDQPHRALADRVAPVHLLELLGIGASEPHLLAVCI